MKWLAVAWLLSAVTVAHAGEVLDTEVIHTDGRYTVRFDVRLAAPPERLKRHLTDYEQYSTHFNSIKESRVLARQSNGTVRLRLQLHSCVLFYCRTITQVKDIAEQADGRIVARIDPTESDFRDTTEQWRILPDNGATRLQYEAELVPTFYIPPLIGPWLVKRQIRAALESGSEKLETLARE